VGDDVKEIVREKYAAAAARVENRTGSASGGCGCGCGPEGGGDAITRDLYGSEDSEGLPEDALAASLGCGNPTALTELHPGEIVLDLGSGGGIDVLLSARRVAPGGKAYGLDMTDEMLELARRNQRAMEIDNAEFLKGEIEAVPLPDASVDVVISNCVVNLSGDKARTLREAFRVLRPGGRLAISDVVVRGVVPEEVRRNMELWAGCVAGALEESEFRGLLSDAGFVDVRIEPTRVYTLEDARAFLEDAGLDPDRVAPQIEDRFMAAFIRARKPVAG
jgi:SAM-dependent methyltransferase